MELAPGVRVLRAADGFNNLGVPMGTDEWVEEELVRMVRAQDKRLKLIVALARHVGSETMSCGRSIGLQSARIMLLLRFRRTLCAANGKSPIWPKINQKLAFCDHPSMQRTTCGGGGRKKKFATNGCHRSPLPTHPGHATPGRSTLAPFSHRRRRRGSSGASTSDRAPTARTGSASD